MLEFLDYEGATRQIDLLRAYIAEATFTFRISPDSAVMAACLLNSATLLTSIIRQSEQFAWATPKYKHERGWDSRALFVVSGAPKEFAKALPFQYYQALNYANRFESPIGRLHEFCHEFWEALHEHWEDSSPDTPSRTANGSVPKSGGTINIPANHPSAKYHRYPKAIAGIPAVPDGPGEVEGCIAYHWTADGFIVMSSSLEAGKRLQSFR